MKLLLSLQIEYKVTINYCAKQPRGQLPIWEYHKDCELERKNEGCFQHRHAYTAIHKVYCTLDIMFTE